MRKVRHSASAENDLLEAWLYVAEESVDAADQLLDRIEAETRTLLIQPKIGRPRDELAAGGPAQLADVDTLRPVSICRRR